jgi:two-component system nitrogen regulation sensor histidine kinase GlnL
MTFDPMRLWASLPLPAFVIDRQDRIEEANPAAEEFMNASAKSLKGEPVWDRLSVDAPLEGVLARVRESRAVFAASDVGLTAGDRPPFHCALQIAPVADDPERAILLIASREISERLERAQSSKKAAKSAIGMAEMLAHEIKNPLAGITGAAQLLSMSLEGEDRELTDLIVAESRRILKLLGQVEQFGNVRPPERRAVNIHDLLDRARKSAAVGFAAHMRFAEDYDPSLPPVWADGDQMLQVILNLLKNAAEAAPGGGTIRLRTFYDYALRLRRSDGTGMPLPIVMEIADDGPGLPPAIAADVFEPFVSGRENGTGLGLALVAKIVAAHEGWVGVESAPGRTMFRISLPVAPKGAPAREEGI